MEDEVRLVQLRPDEDQDAQLIHIDSGGGKPAHGAVGTLCERHARCAWTNQTSRYGLPLRPRLAVTRR